MPPAADATQLLAAMHHRRWVHVGILVVLAGYVLSIASHLTEAGDFFYAAGPEFGVLVIALGALVVFHRGRTVAAAQIVIGALWLELHMGAVQTGAITTPGAPALPVLIVGAALLLDGGRAFVLAAVSVLTFPLAVQLGAARFGTGPGIQSRDIPFLVVLTVTILSAAFLMKLGLRAYGAVLAAAQASERRYRQLVDHAPDGIVLLDALGRIEALNRVAERLLHRPARSDVIGRPLEGLLAELNGDAPAPALTADAAPDATPRTLPAMSLSGADGRTVHVEISVVPVPREDGTAGTQVTLRDVTHRQEMELRATQLGRMLDQAQSEIYVFDPVTLGLRFVNRGARRNLGFEADELAGRAVSDINPGLVRARIQAFLRDTEAAPAAESESSRAVHRRKDGTVYPVELQLQRGVFDGEKVVVAFALDVAERVANERERERLQSQLLHAQKMEAMGQLAGGVAHDFNNILMAIGGYAEILEESSDGRPAEWAREIRKAQERGAAFTRQLLTFTRRDVTLAEPVAVSGVLADLQPMLRTLLGQHELRVEVEGDPVVHADRSQLEQVIINLVTNARDAMPAGGLVQVSAAPSADVDGCVCLEVRDTGSGMDAATIQRIFDPFFTTKPRGKGTGLGLATVHGIVVRHGGRVDVESTPGWGTRMRVIWPEAVRADRQPSLAAPAAGAQRPATVLLVEDDESARTLLGLMLQRAGHRVIMAGSAEEALGKLTEAGDSVDLLLTDIVLPGLNGLDLARRIRGEHPNVRALFMSGYLDVPETTEGFDAVSALLLKPFARDVLLRRVADALRQAPVAAAPTSAATAK